MALRRCHETDATVTMLVVVPGGELRDPFPGVEQVVKPRFSIRLVARVRKVLKRGEKRRKTVGGVVTLR